MKAQGILPGGCVVTQPPSQANTVAQDKIGQAFAEQFPPRYTSMLEIVPGSLKLREAYAGLIEFNLTANEYNGSLTGSKILKGQKEYKGFYNPGNGHVSFQEIVRNQSGAGVTSL